MKIMPFMTGVGEQKHVTENYVSVPPALTITDETGSIWTLGFKFGKIAPKGEYAFNVLRDGIEIGEFASRIERRKGQIWIFTAEGWKKVRVIKRELVQVFGIGAKIATEYNENIKIKIYSNDQLDPIITYLFNPRVMNIEDLTRSPINCMPGQWLCARVEPAKIEPFVTVMAYLGGSNMREIPVLGGTVR
jgi:hypothetical protein